MTSNRREGAGVLWAGLALGLFTSLPFLLGAILSTPQHEFAGFVIGFEDGNSYLANMLQGAHGAWTYQLAFTPEPHSGGLFFLMYLLLGKVAAFTSVPPIWLFHLTRFIATPLALYAFYCLAAYFSPHPTVRRLAVALFAVGGGLGWLWILLGQSTALGRMPVDLWVPDASFFLSALTYPHLIVGQALLFAYSLWTLRFLDLGHWQDGAGAALAGVGVSLIHPYTLPVIVAPFGLFVLWRGRRDFSTFWRLGVRLAATALPSLPYLLYAVVFFRANPAYAAWQAQNLLYSPAPDLYLLGFGLPLLLAATGLLLGRQPDVLSAPAFLCLWTLIVPPLLYLPTPLQRRFLDGYQAPVAVLGGAGLYLIVKRLHSMRWRAGLTAGLIVVIALTNILLWVGSIATIAAKIEPIFRPGWEMSAARWFESTPASPVVLASYDTGNLLPAYALVRSFTGHGSETINSEEKTSQVAQFFRAETSDAWRAGLLSHYAVDYVYYGPRERQLGASNLQRFLYLTPVYDNGQVQILHVDRSALLRVTNP
jgi:hypothetical protein